MHKYEVVERRTDDSRLALRCHMGRYHVARVLNALPLAQATLNGQRPHLGFGILLCTVSGAIYRVIFESVNHADLASSPGWTTNASPSAQPPSAQPAHRGESHGGS